jgi:peptidoglycan/xylan/chitin deacetylase (PgdA/CDA1 family)
MNQLRRIVPKSWKRAATDHDFWFQAKLHLLTRPVYSGLGSILALHRVCPAPERPQLGLNKDLEVTPELLEDTIKFFKHKGYDLVSLDQVYEILKTGKPQNRFVAFTIDDGYLDNYTNAYPIFKKHNVPFTIYVATCFPDREAILWWYVLEELLWQRDELKIELDNEQVTYDCSTLAKKEQVFDTAAGHLTFAGSEEEVKAILRDYSSDLYSHVKDLALNWDQIIELSKDPLVTIGSHTRRHLALSKLALSDARAEVLQSQQKIHERTGKQVEHFAYPYGGRQAAGVREFQIVKDFGFKTATTTRNGNIFASHKNNLECLPRIPVSGAELRKNIAYLNLWVDGLVPCHENSFQRVMTV